MTSTSADKKYMRALGHQLKPVVIVAGNGLTESVSAELDRALGDHELIKVKLDVGDRDARKAIIDEICYKSKAKLIQSIGHMILLFRKAEKPHPRLSNLLRK